MIGRVTGGEEMKEECKEMEGFSRKAVRECGSSDRNIRAFVEEM